MFELLSPTELSSRIGALGRKHWLEVVGNFSTLLLFIEVRLAEVSPASMDRSNSFWIRGRCAWRLK